MTLPGPDPAGLADYFEQRRMEREADVVRRWQALTNRERKLVREAMVLGYVRGFMAGPYSTEVPNDQDIIVDVMSSAPSFPDIYPTLTRLIRLKVKR